MQASVLWRVAIQTTAEAEEPVSELLAEIFGEPVSSYTELRSSNSRVETYLPSKPASIRATMERVQTALAHLRARGLHVGTGRVTLRRLPRRNWADSWKRHFQPLEIGGKLLLKPSWSRPKARPGCVVVVLDPGLSFGTGQHPTTGFCLEQLVQFRRAGERQSFLDVGTGSGVLAIAAARMGYRPVAGFDLDPEAIRSARANARRNRLGRHIQFHQQDLAGAGRRALQRRYSVVCANLTADLLMDYRDRLLSWLQPGGLLVLAGILKQEFGRVRRRFSEAGLRLMASRKQGEWHSGSFQLRA
jgi:ribosomal protein L11 methyltransferase